MLAQQIVDRVRALAFIPNTTEFSDANLLAEINVAQVEDVVPAIVKVNGEYFTEILDVTPDTTGYARLPAAALASTARLITWVDPYGRESKPLNHIEIADISTIQATGYAVGQPYAFTLLPDGIQLGGSLENGALRVRYSRLPSDLILPSSSTANEWTTVVSKDVTGMFWVAAFTPVSGTGAPSAPLDITDALSPHRLIIGSLRTTSISETLTLSGVTVSSANRVYITVNGVLTQFTGITSGALLNLQQYNVGISDTATATNLAACIAGQGVAPSPLIPSLLGVTATSNGAVVTINFPTTNFSVVSPGNEITPANAQSWVIAPVDGGAGSSLAARVLAGSYATAAGVSVLPQYPKEWHNLLVYFGAALMAYRRKDYSLQASLRQSAQMLQDKLTDVSQPRTKQNPKVISAWRGHGGRGNGRF